MNPHIYLTSEEHIKAVESLKRVDEKGYLYHMDCNYNYYDIPAPFKNMIDAGCSTFFKNNLENQHLMYRNYDYSHYLNNDKKNERTGLNVVVEANNPLAKYKSIGVCDAYWLDYEHGSYQNGAIDDGKTDLSAFILCPYLCMDGINDQGLAISVMALAVKTIWEEIPYDTYEEKLNLEKENLYLRKANEKPDELARRVEEGSLAINVVDKKAWIAHPEKVCTTMPNKKPVLPPILMRMILDNCSNVKEAVAYADQFNIVTPQAGSDYHIMIADKSGDCKLLEWIDNHMNAISVNHSTNYRQSADDTFHKYCERDEIIKASLNYYDKGLTEELGVCVMQLASQDPDVNSKVGKTQYSCVYNLDDLSVKVYSFCDFSKYFKYQL